MFTNGASCETQPADSRTSTVGRNERVAMQSNRGWCVEFIGTFTTAPEARQRGASISGEDHELTRSGRRDDEHTIGDGEGSDVAEPVSALLRTEATNFAELNGSDWRSYELRGRQVGEVPRVTARLGRRHRGVARLRSTAGQKDKPDSDDAGNVRNTPSPVWRKPRALRSAYSLRSLCAPVR